MNFASSPAELSAVENISIQQRRDLFTARSRWLDFFFGFISDGRKSKFENGGRPGCLPDHARLNRARAGIPLSWNADQAGVHRGRLPLGWGQSEARPVMWLS